MNKSYEDSIVTAEYLKENQDHIFVFGDNLKGVGKGGAAIHRDALNSYGFITKKYPSYANSSYYKSKEYETVFNNEIKRLSKDIKACPHLTFLISKLGSGLANRYNIWEEVIKDGLKDLEQYDNVRFLFDVNE